MSGYIIDLAAHPLTGSGPVPVGWLILAAAVLAVVLGLAVWSRKKHRRDAGLAVLQVSTLTAGGPPSDLDTVNAGRSGARSS